LFPVKGEKTTITAVLTQIGIATKVKPLYGGGGAGWGEMGVMKKVEYYLNSNLSHGTTRELKLLECQVRQRGQKSTTLEKYS
jgi:hypothetical protein